MLNKDKVASMYNSCIISISFQIKPTFISTGNTNQNLEKMEMNWVISSDYADADHVCNKIYRQVIFPKKFKYIQLSKIRLKKINMNYHTCNYIASHEHLMGLQDYILLYTIKKNFQNSFVRIKQIYFYFFSCHLCVHAYKNIYFYASKCVDV